VEGGQAVGQVEVSVSETVLVDPLGAPQLCRPYIDALKLAPITTVVPVAAGLPTVLDRTRFSTAALPAPASTAHLNATIESQGAWLVELRLDRPARLGLQVSARTVVPCLAGRGAPPTLASFDILAVLDGAARETVHWELGAGEWHLRLANEEFFDQEVLVSLTREETSSSSPCCRPGCRLLEGGLRCRGEAAPAPACEHGEERGGRCHCEPDWLGPSCRVSLARCREERCGGRGDCREQEDGLGYTALVCSCQEGTTGQDCREEECRCGDNGVCERAGRWRS
jgi:hypothetical protein